MDVYMKGICVLGSTGSIGVSTLDVVARHPDQYKVIALTANTNIDDLFQQCIDHHPEYVVVVDAKKADQFKQQINTSEIADIKVLAGAAELATVATLGAVDSVMAAIVGAAGLLPSLAAAKAGKTILLANKEALVMSGDIFMQAVAESGATLLPIDSEHNAIFQCLDNNTKVFNENVAEIVITASGGPFRDKAISELTNITPEQACAHPNWDMGKKISVDSSTMVNKALEVVEAYWLFGVPIDNVKVLIHPQSIIHSMVKYIDGSFLAQLGSPDMKTPIANAMYYPSRGATNVAELDFTTTELTFKKACFDRFEALEIVFDNLRNKKYAANIVFNAANEVLVSAFLDEKIKYLDIVRINKKVVKELNFENPIDIEQVFEIDSKTREYVGSLLR
jgi:1-deoxy-D-xylulose-5-phosphate reductoisomerase